jgi:hypothetical protein
MMKNRKTYLLVAGATLVTAAALANFGSARADGTEPVNDSGALEDYAATCADALSPVLDECLSVPGSLAPGGHDLEITVGSQDSGGRVRGVSPRDPADRALADCILSHGDDLSLPKPPLTRGQLTFVLRVMAVPS